MKRNAGLSSKLNKVEYHNTYRDDCTMRSAGATTSVIMRNHDHYSNFDFTLIDFASWAAVRHWAFDDPELILEKIYICRFKLWLVSGEVKLLAIGDHCRRILVPWGFTAFEAYHHRLKTFSFELGKDWPKDHVRLRNIRKISGCVAQPCRAQTYKLHSSTMGQLSSDFHSTPISYPTRTRLLSPRSA